MNEKADLQDGKNVEMKNKTRNITYALRLLAFVIVLFAAVWVVRRYMRFQYSDGITDWDVFYDQEQDSIDVIAFGSSHAYTTINTAVLYDEYGMSSFVLGGSCQPIWDSYYWMKEALKTQSPKVLLLEGASLTRTVDFEADDKNIKNTYGMKPSFNRLQAMMAGTPRHKWLEIIPEFYQYHNRYEDMTKSDFVTNETLSYWKGSILFTGAESHEQTEINGITDKAAMTGKIEMYYRRILELAEDEGVQVCVVIAPYAGITESDKRIYNEAESIAEEYGVVFKDFNEDYEEIGLDYEEDCADIEHLNAYGNQKFSSYLGAWLSEHYEIPNHMGEQAYADYEENVWRYKQTIFFAELENVEDYESYQEAVNGSEYMKDVIAIVIQTDETGTITMQQVEKNGEILYQSNGTGTTYRCQLGKWKELSIDSSGNVTIDGEMYEREPGYQCVLFDTSDQSLKANLHYEK